MKRLRGEVARRDMEARGKEEVRREVEARGEVEAKGGGGGRKF